MAKKSKRKQIEDRLYKLWCKIIHSKGRCEICGKNDGKLDAHHIVGRVGKMKYWLDNGILLCFRCHRLGAHSETWDSQDDFHKALIALRGEDQLEELRRLKYDAHKLTTPELENMEEEYKLKLKDFD